MKGPISRFDRIVFSAIILLIAFGVLARVSVHEKKSTAKEPVSTTTTTKKSGPTSSTLTPTTISDKTAPFAAISYTVTAGGYTTDEKCALLAKSQTALETGWAGKTDLGGYDSMIFVFPRDSIDEFWGRGVQVPLAIFWFDANGKYIDQNTINPCPATAKNCPTVGATVPFRYAVEVPKNGFSNSNLREGSTLTLGGGCSR